MVVFFKYIFAPFRATIAFEKGLSIYIITFSILTLVFSPMATIKLVKPYI